MNKTPQGDGLIRFEHRQDNVVVIVTVSALRFNDGGAPVQISRDEAADFLRIAAHHVKGFAQVDALNHVIDDKRLCHEAEDGKDQTYEFCGRQYTLRGNAVDKNATVLQFIPFDKAEDTMNFLFGGDKLTMLDRGLRPIDSNLNYTLQLQ